MELPLDSEIAKEQTVSTICGQSMCWGPWNENSPAATFYGFSFPLGQSVALPYFQAQPNLTSTLRNYEQVHKARHKLI